MIEAKNILEKFSEIKTEHPTPAACWIHLVQTNSCSTTALPPRNILSPTDTDSKPSLTTYIKSSQLKLHILYVTINLFIHFVLLYDFKEEKTDIIWLIDGFCVYVCVEGVHGVVHMHARAEEGTGCLPLLLSTLVP